MKEKSVSLLALCGILSAFQLQGNEKPDAEKAADENTGYYLMTEEELLGNVNQESRKIYQGLSAEGKQLALQVASQRCNNTNDCKGLNACKTEENACAGQGSCKHLSKCAFADKNLAVKIAAKKMLEKRNSTLNGSK